MLWPERANLLADCNEAVAWTDVADASCLSAEHMAPTGSGRVVERLVGSLDTSCCKWTDLEYVAVDGIDSFAWLRVLKHSELVCAQPAEHGTVVCLVLQPAAAAVYLAQATL